jgi:hypothetical protein
MCEYQAFKRYKCSGKPPSFRVCPKRGNKISHMPQILTEVPPLSWNVKNVGTRIGGVEGLQIKKAQKCKSHNSLRISVFPAFSSNPVNLDKSTPIAKN